MDGLDRFREAFREFSDNYVIIGGSACEIVMTGTAVRPRATHDIDMIVILENMTPEFGQRFWNFIVEAGYRPERNKPKDGEAMKYQMYRFLDGRPGYPPMIELLSRHSDALGEPKGLTIEPMAISEDVSSLSAIIMDDDYYRFTIENSTLTNGIRHATPVALIVLKARAYLNLLNDKANGKHVNTYDIKKHRSDVLKNIAIMPSETVFVPNTIKSCIDDFINEIKNNQDELYPALAKSLDVTPSLIGQLLEQLNTIFVSE